MKGSLKKVLMISARSDMGGGPRHLELLCQGIKEEFPNTLITIAAPDEKPFAPIFAHLADEFIPIPHRRFSILTLLRLLLFCKSHEIDVVHSHGRGAGLYSRLLGLFNQKIVHTFHGAHNESSFIGQLKLKLDLFLSHQTATYISVSNDEAKSILKLRLNGTSNPLKIILNGVDTSQLEQQHSLLDKNESRQYFNLPQDKTLIGTMARHHYQKGLDLLMKELGSQEWPPNWHFVIIGDGPESQTLKELSIEHKVKNLTFLPSTQETVSYLKCLDIYFSYSRWEGLPLSVLEAMAVALPCVLSNVEGHRDLRDGVSLFGPNQFKIKLEEALIKQVEFGQKSKSYVNKHHTVKTMAAQTYLTY